MILRRVSRAHLATAALQVGWLFEFVLDAATDLAPYVADLIARWPSWTRAGVADFLQKLRNQAAPHTIQVSCTGDFLQIYFCFSIVDLGGTLWLILRDSIPGHGTQIRLRYRDRAACLAADRALSSARRRGTGRHTIRGDAGECLLRIGVKKIYAAGCDLPATIHPAPIRDLRTAPPDWRSLAAGIHS